MFGNCFTEYILSNLKTRNQSVCGTAVFSISPFLISQFQICFLHSKETRLKINDRVSVYLSTLHTLKENETQSLFRLPASKCYLILIRLLCWQPSSDPVWFREAGTRSLEPEMRPGAWTRHEPRSDQIKLQLVTSVSRGAANTSCYRSQAHSSELSQGKLLIKTKNYSEVTWPDIVKVCDV